MRTKIIEIPRSKKKPEIIEGEVNKILSKYNLFYAHQMENDNTGKIVLTLILKNYDPKAKGIVQVKVFRKNKIKETEAEMNKFMSKKATKVKFFTQSFSGNTITSLVFHEISKEKPTDPNPTTNENTQTDPPTTDNNPETNTEANGKE